MDTQLQISSQEPLSILEIHLDSEKPEADYYNSLHFSFS